MHDLAFFRANLEEVAQRLAKREFVLDVEEFRNLVLNGNHPLK